MSNSTDRSTIAYALGVAIEHEDDLKVKKEMEELEEHVCTNPPITNEEILALMKERSLDIFQVIDVIVEANHFVGVGFITFEEMVVKYIREKAKQTSKTPSYPEVMND